MSCEETKVGFGQPISVEREYKFLVTYAYPGPLLRLSGVQVGCSEVVDAGPELGGLGSFCDYMMVCAGTTVTILYNEFRLAA